MFNNVISKEKNTALENYFLAKASRLAEKARGDCSPNPLVGAVVVKDGQIVGQGYHQQAGQPHAEVIALNEAGAKSKGADLYVTLEPCSHYGRTPPCVKAIVKAGIKRVFIGIQDPNPKVNGEGIKYLQANGVQVKAGICETLIKQQLAAYIKYITTGLPYVNLKAALSLDGKMTAKPSTRTPITGVKAKKQVQILRKEADAVLTGINSVVIDNPLLTYRLKKEKKAPLYRVVADTYGRMPLMSNLVKTISSATPLIVATTSLAAKERLAALEAVGATVLLCRLNNKQVDLVDLLQKLAQKGIVNLLVEAGPKLSEAFLKQHLVDKITLFLAPVWFGTSGLNWLTKLPPNFVFTSAKKVGTDIMITASLEK